MGADVKNRIELAKYFGELGFKKGVEVGLCHGRYAKILYENIPDLQLMGIDAFRPYGGHGINRKQSTHDSNMITAHEALKDYPNFVMVVGSAHEASKWIANESLDFVFIDSDHSYEAVKQDIADWTPKVRKGGIVSGHDYYNGKYNKMGVVQAVDEFIAEHPGYHLQTTEWDETAERDDRQPDWWFLR
jgi:hypothetical protein